MAIMIRYNLATINSGGSNGGIFNGENQGFGWMSHSKSNSNTGITGYFNPSPANLNVVNDNDVIDTVLNDQDIEVGGSGQAV